MPPSDLKASCAVSRSNLLLITRLVVRGLLENCMQLKCRMLHSEHQQLRDFFVVVEKVLRHGFKASKNMISIRTPDQEMWNMIERLSKQSGELKESVQCIEQLPNVHSSLSRIRSWLRLAMMQKKLSDYFGIMIEAKSLLKEYYDDWALLRNETDSVVFVGSLIGIRVLDCNLYLKEDDLINQPLEVDLNLYVKLPSVPTEDEVVQSERLESKEKCDEEMKTLLDQKNFLEERNRALTVVLENLKQRLHLMEGMRQHRSVGEESVDEKEIPSEEMQNLDICRLSRVEEMETAMALLEKSVHEKQDTIVSIRQQIEDVKKINLDLYQKLRVAEDGLKNKEKQVANLKDELDLTKCRYQDQVRLLEISLSNSEGRLEKSEQLICSLQSEIEQQKVDFSATLKSEIDEMQGFNLMLEESLKAERMVRHELDAQIETFKLNENDFTSLKRLNLQLTKKIHEYEKTLEELGVSLSESKLKVDELQEGMQPLADAQWENDKETVACKQCQQRFSVSIRKHHCRNCGGIFCNTCSENTMPLPSSAKPVRVCDTCYKVLLDRLSTKNPSVNSA